MGDCNKQTAFEILDYFFSKGGNFIDTAVNYQDGESEVWIGEWMAAHKNRDQVVLATKFTTNFQVHLGHEKRINSNFGGNNTKCLNLSVETSLQRLQTAYIDILYVHWWDHTTSVSELMLALNNLVRQGKVLYLGASDCPAWFVAKCNQYARDHGLQGFVVYQGQWSAANRSFERDILGLCAEDGMAIAPWGALGGGQFKSASSPEKGRSTVYPSEHAAAVREVLEKLAERKGTLTTSVALAYVTHKAPYVFPIVGGRKLEHLKANIEALALELTAEDISMIEGAAPFNLGFPLDLIGPFAEKCGLMNVRGHFDYVPRVQPIKMQAVPLIEKQ
jgi:aryl-alcohol dehydrogenase-like predicted oxidoreductase